MINTQNIKFEHVVYPQPIMESDKNLEPQHYHIVIGILVLIIIVLLIRSCITTSYDECDDMIDLSILEDARYGHNRNCNCNKHKLLAHAEHFADYADVGFEPDYGWLSQNGLLPWWNSTRHTRNMSYDLRGDVPITPSYVGPWLNSELI
jgi:hypothetical protein